MSFQIWPPGERFTVAVPRPPSEVAGRIARAGDDGRFDVAHDGARFRMTWRGTASTEAPSPGSAPRRTSTPVVEGVLEPGGEGTIARITISQEPGAAAFVIVVVGGLACALLSGYAFPDATRIWWMIGGTLACVCVTMWWSVRTGARVVLPDVRRMLGAPGS